MKCRNDLMFMYLFLVFENSNRIQKTINQRLFLMKRLSAFNVDKVLLGLFYE